MEKSKLKELTELALEAAFAAGEKIMEIYSAKIAVDFKTDGSPLTEADRAAHHTIVAFLKDTGFPVLSEEGRDIEFDERSKWEYYWLVDPLDGTKEFIKKNGEFTVNIALMKNGVPLSGVIFQPTAGKAFAGIAGDGLYMFSLNDKPFISNERRIKFETGKATTKTQSKTVKRESFSRNGMPCSPFR